jgi:hypothetical protein
MQVLFSDAQSVEHGTVVAVGLAAFAEHWLTASSTRWSHTAETVTLHVAPVQPDTQ